MIARVDLGTDESVSTSGDYERTAMLNGKRAHHLLDPRTGEPALHTMSVTVIARDATLADAASTAVFIAGPDRWLQVAKALQVTGVVRIDATGRLQATRSLQPRLHVSELTVAIEWLDL
jgi:thiamine biosynthesis lipoprotein